MTAEPQRAQELFEQALERPFVERSAFLDGACGDDLELRRRVQALLDALDAADAFLPDEAQDPGPVSEQPGEVIDRYRLLESIGEGGFGIVWMAEQFEPVRRKVALKIIKAGMDTRQVVARFEAERQALALMDHPNIARVLDGGVTPSGRPYFAMDLVAGLPITDYCDRAGLDAAARLELFQQVCQAVQHAHHKSVIHRDLKPSNVLVTEHGGVPVPKVIDFGIAKATDAELTQRTLFTGFQQIVGTPEYMSPEQAALSGLDVDTRADVYALGVLLYELLTGTRPFEQEMLREKGYLEMLRVIREDEPPKPSTRVSTLGERIDVVARQRQTSPQSLRRQVSGDLDWIVMRAMEKDRSRRYASPLDLAADIGRHLGDEPVLAGPPGMAYRLRKYVRRHAVMVGAGIAIALALIAGFTVALWGWFEANQQRRRAEDAERLAVVERDQTALERDRAREERERADRERDVANAARRAAEAARGFLTTTIGLANPDISRDPEIPARALLDEAAGKVGGAFPALPAAEAEVRTAIGEAYLALGETRLAGDQLYEAIRLWHGSGVASHSDLHRAVWGFFVARSGQRRNFAIRQQIMVLAREIVAGGNVDLAAAMHRLVHRRDQQPRLIHGTAADLEHALAVVDDELAAAPDPVAARWRSMVFGDLLVAMPDIGGSRERCLRTALDVYRDLAGLPVTHSRVIHGQLFLLRELLRDATRPDAAIAFARRMLASLEDFLPDTHWCLARCRLSLGQALTRRYLLGRDREARRVDLDEALALLEESLEHLEAELLHGSNQALRGVAALIRCHEAAGQGTEAAAWRSRLVAAIPAMVDKVAVETVVTALGPEHRTLAEQFLLFDAAMQQPARQEQLFHDAFAKIRELPGTSPVLLVATVHLLHCGNRLVNHTGDDFLRTGLVPANEFAIRVLSPTEHPDMLAMAHWRLGDLQRHYGEYAAATVNLRRAQELKVDHGGFAETTPGQRDFRQGTLARSLLGEGRLAEAERLAREAYDGLRLIRGESNNDLNNVFQFWIQTRLAQGEAKRQAAVATCIERCDRAVADSSQAHAMSATISSLRVQLGADVEADRQAARMAERYPLDSRPWLHRATLAALRYDAAAVQRFAAEALARGEDDYEVHRMLAGAFSRCGQLERALDHARRTAELWNSTAVRDLHEQIRRSWEPEDLERDSPVELDRKPPLDRPGNEWVWRRYGAAMASAGRLEEVRESLAELTSRWSADPVAWSCRARVLATASGATPDDHEQALSCAERAVELSGRRGPVMLATLAEVRFALGDRQGAVAAAEEAAERCGHRNAQYFDHAELQGALTRYRR